MSDDIWFELADCIGEALAKRWLARRSQARDKRRTDASRSPASDEAPATGTSAEVQTDESYQEPSPREERI